MRIPARPVTTSIAFNMTPLIDVVFLLITFFLLSSHLARQETHYPLSLPAAQSAQPDSKTNPPRLTITVLDSGDALVANRPVKPDELTVLLADRRQTHGDALEVLIRADRSIHYAHVEAILFACNRAGIHTITFAITPKTEN